MFDIKLIRDEPEFFDSKWKLRGLEPQTPELIEIDEKRRSIMNELQELQSKRNDASKEIGLNWQTIRQMCLRGDIKTVKAGRKWILTTKALAEYLDNERQKEEFVAIPQGRSRYKKIV